MKSNSYDFYKLFYEVGYLTLDEIKEACKWNVITKEEFKEITGQEYKE